MPPRLQLSSINIKKKKKKKRKWKDKRVKKKEKDTCVQIFDGFKSGEEFREWFERIRLFLVKLNLTQNFIQSPHFVNVAHH